MNKKITRIIRQISIYSVLGLAVIVIAFAYSNKKVSAQKGETPTAIFTNSTPIIINDASTASPYPSGISVSGLTGNIPVTAGAVKVTLNGFSHSFPDDIGIVLRAPNGDSLLLQDGAGDDPDMNNITYTISDSGATVLPNLTAWAAGTYRPTTYYTGDSFPAPGPLLAYGSPGPTGGGTATFGSVFGGDSPNGTWNLFVVDFVAGDDGDIAGGWTLEIDLPSTPTGTQHVVDYDGDFKTDPSVVRNVGGGSGGQVRWFNRLSSTGNPDARDWGIATDFFVPEDYDGDGKTDISVWRPAAPGSAQWFTLNSNGNTVTVQTFGQTGDDPTVVGDYDGDNKADVAVYRGGAMSGDPSTWYYRGSLSNPGGNITSTLWGKNGDFPVPGDFDGDGKHDLGIQRNASGSGFFWRLLSNGGSDQFLFGNSSDVIVPGDYDGDNKTDIATVRGSGGQILWHVRKSTDLSTVGYLWGLSATDFPTQGDWDGDGKTDIAVWRPNADPNLNIFYYLGSTSGSTGTEWGQQGDYPVANYNAH